MITAAVMEIFVYIKGQINTYMSIPACVAQSSTLVVTHPKAATARAAGSDKCSGFPYLSIACFTSAVGHYKPPMKARQVEFF